MKKQNSLSFDLIMYFIAFSEGAALLVAEVCSAKLIESQLGSSLYVWSSVLSITLIGLAIGYFVGGHYSKNDNSKRLLFFYLSIGGLFILAMPYLSYYSLQLFIDFDTFWSSLLSTMVFLLPPMILLGCVSPTLIELSSNKANAGKIAGRIFGISTLGGVVGVLLAVLFLIPSFGLSNTCMVFGILLIAISLLIKFPLNRFIRVALILIPIALIFLSNSHVDAEVRAERIFHSNKLLSTSELIKSSTLLDKTGIFGSVKVVDYDVKYSNVVGTIRALLVNNTLQTLITKNGNSLLDYTDFMKGIFNGLPNHNNILHIGLGGGIVSTHLSKLGKKVTAVEIDQNVINAAKKYFNLSNSVDVVLDDGRHFLNKSKKTFDLIVLNAFNGDIPPWSLFTTQSFEKCFKRTNKNGVVVVEIGGIIQGDKDPLLSSICKTIEEAGWKIKLFRTSMSDDNSDYIAVGYKKEPLDISNWISLIKGQNVYLKQYEIQRSTLNEQIGQVFTDDNPILYNLVSKQLYDMSR